MEEVGLEETERLVRGAQAGEGDALEALFARYLPRVRQMVALRLGRRIAAMEECEDLVQEALLGAFRDLGSFEHRSVGSFRNWLAKIALNRVREDARRAGAAKRGLGRVVEVDLAASAVLADTVLRRDPSPSEVARANELQERLESALLELSERECRVIELRRVGGLSFDEIALELGLGGASSARSLFARALQRLSERL